jgi:hypothetical protein
VVLPGSFVRQSFVRFASPAEILPEHRSTRSSSAQVDSGDTRELEGEGTSGAD